MLDIMESANVADTPEFKLKVVLESLQRDTTLEAVCQRFGVSKSMVHRWRQHFSGQCSHCAAGQTQSQAESSGAGLSTWRVA